MRADREAGFTLLEALIAFAILALASRLGLASGQTGTSIGLVMAARIVPGLFFSAPVGALIDRLDRKQVMVITMLVRAGVVPLRAG